MLTAQKFKKREAVRLPIQGDCIIECEKIRVVNTQGREMTTLYFHEAVELRDALIRLLPQGLVLSDLFPQGLPTRSTRPPGDRL